MGGRGVSGRGRVGGGGVRVNVNEELKFLWGGGVGGGVGGSVGGVGLGGQSGCERRIEVFVGGGVRWGGGGGGRGRGRVGGSEWM